MNYVTN